MARNRIEKSSSIPDNDDIIAKVLDIENGFATYRNVRAIRIKSKKFTLLVMHNYTPTLGEVDGSVDILVKDDEIHYENIKAYFEFNENKFTLLIKERK